MQLDFLAIGDTVVDEFIRLKEASVHCNIDTDACTISMRWGDKIPFESATLVAGVGNSANAAVASARLGLATGFVANVGDDRDADEVFEALEKENLDTRYITRNTGLRTNHHFVLWYESERTILVKPEAYPYNFPNDLPEAKAVYLSSIGDANENYYASIADYLDLHLESFVTFQPGTFQMKLGTEKLARIYRRADLLVVNKEEAYRILNVPEGTHEPKELMAALRQLGPKTVIVSDGRNGAYALKDDRALFIPMYPDGRAPFERTGSGDAFASTITSALALGIPFEEALLWGPINSMSVVQEMGAQKGLLSRAVLEEYLVRAPKEYRLTEL